MTRLQIEGSAPLDIPTVCPFAVADLLPPDGSAPNIDALVAKLSE